MPHNRTIYCADGEQMPNWCMNDVSMHGSKEHMKLFLSEFCDEDPNGTGMYRLVYQKISPVDEYEKDETNFNLSSRIYLNFIIDFKFVLTVEKVSSAVFS